MRFISTKLHGMLDYIVGILLIAAPWIFNFNDGSSAQWVPVILGIVIILMSGMTNYEAGLLKVIPMSMHLTMDVIAGIFLAASPWLFGFADRVYLPHLLVGLFSIGAGLFTELTPHHQGYRDRMNLGHDDMRHAH
jgi:hypothetical protein